MSETAIAAGVERLAAAVARHGEALDIHPDKE
jgi:hypothetical protein